MEIFDSIKDKLSEAFSGSGPTVLGVDISDAFIKVVELERVNQRARLDTYGKIALGPYGKKEIGQVTNLSQNAAIEALEDVLREAKVTTKNCGVSVPMSASLTAFVEVPDVSQEKLENIVPIEARKHIPVPLSEVYLDWHIIPQKEVEYGQGEDSEEDKLKILIVAIHKESIQTFQKIIEGADLTPTFFEVEVFSSIRSSLEQNEKKAMLVDVGASITKAYIVKHGLVRDSHVINRGGQDITRSAAKSLEMSFGEAEQLKREVGMTNPNNTQEGATMRDTASVIFEEIFGEVQQILMDYESSNNESINQVVLTGGTAILSGLDDFAKQTIDADVRVTDPFRKVKAPAFLDEVLQKRGPEFAVSLGAALRDLE